MFVTRVEAGNLVRQIAPFLRADESALRPGGALPVVPACPDRTVVGERELRGLARDGKGIHPGLLGKNHAQAHTVVERPGDHAKGAIAIFQRQGQFLVMIPHVAVLAPLVYPMGVDRFPCLALHHGFLAQLHIAFQFQPQAGPHQQRLAVHGDAVAQRGVGVDGDGDLPVGRTNFVGRPGLRGGGQ